MSTQLTFFFAFVVVLALIGAAAWLVRRFAGNRLGSNANRGRMPRLAVIDAAAVDGRRRLVLVRRDNVEHLLMIGGPTDVVVEANIVRAVSTARDVPRELTTRDVPRDIPREMPAPSRTPSLSDMPVRPMPLGEGSLWPLQPETVARPQRPPENLAAPAEELSGRTPPQRPAAPMPEPSRPAPPAEPPVATPSADQNLAEMANRLEAALRGSNEPRRQEAVKSEAKEFKESAAPATEPKPAQAEVKPAGPPKSLYDSLEQEMASLLGRPPGKS
jgi:flagellar biogenesis protein FliO